jgi:hypothetical protein
MTRLTTLTCWIQAIHFLPSQASILGRRLLPLLAPFHRSHLQIHLPSASSPAPTSSSSFCIRSVDRMMTCANGGSFASPSVLPRHPTHPASTMANILSSSSFPTRQTTVIMPQINASGCSITINRNSLGSVHHLTPISSALPIPPKHTHYITNSFRFVVIQISPIRIHIYTVPLTLLLLMVAKVVTVLIRLIGRFFAPAPLCFTIRFLPSRIRPTQSTLTHALTLQSNIPPFHAMHLSTCTMCHNQNTGSYILDKRSSIYSQPTPLFLLDFFFLVPLGYDGSFDLVHRFFRSLFGPLPSMESFTQRLSSHGPFNIVHTTR